MLTNNVYKNEKWELAPSRMGKEIKNNECKGTDSCCSDLLVFGDNDCTFSVMSENGEPSVDNVGGFEGRVFLHPKLFFFNNK